MWDPTKDISDGFWEKLKWYVYKLVDPEDNKVFYIGKGRGSRVVDHLKMAVNERLVVKEGGMSAKLSKIKEICDRNNGDKNRPLHQIICHQLETEAEALRIEAILIQQTPDLTNEQAGHNIDDFGSSNLQELVWKLDAKPMSRIEHDAILLNIKNTYKPNLTNMTWKSLRKLPNSMGCGEAREKVNLALAIFGDVCEVFEDLNWYEATKKIFLKWLMTNQESGALHKTANQTILEQYLNKKIPAELRWKRGQATSFRYFPKDLPYRWFHCVGLIRLCFYQKYQIRA